MACYRIDDAVEIIGGEYIGQSGIIVTASATDGKNYLGILLEEAVEDGSDLNGVCEEGKGIWVLCEHVKKAPKFVMGDEVYIKTNTMFNGFKAKIIEYTDDSLYKLEFEDELPSDLTPNEAGYSEDDLIKAVNVREVLFRHGDLVRLKPYEQVIAELGDKVEEVRPDKIRLKDTSDDIYISDYYAISPGVIYTVDYVTYTRGEERRVGLTRQIGEESQDTPTTTEIWLEKVEGATDDDINKAFWMDVSKFDASGFNNNMSGSGVTSTYYGGREDKFIKALVPIVAYPSFKDNADRIFDSIDRNHCPYQSIYAWDYIHQYQDGEIVTRIDSSVSSGSEIVYCSVYRDMFPIEDEKIIAFKTWLEGNAAAINEKKTVAIVDRYVFLFVPGNDVEELYDALVFVADHYNCLTPEFIEALKAKDIEKINVSLANCKNDFEKIRFEMMLAKAEKNYDESIGRKEKDGVIRSISSSKERVRNMEENLRQEYKTIRELEQRLIGINTGEKGPNVLFEFLKSMKNSLRYFQLYDNYIDLTIVQPLIMFDRDEFVAIDVRNNYDYKDCPIWVLSLLEDLFLHEKYTLYFEQSVRLGVGNGSINGESKWRFSNMPAVGIPNPHHYYYNCWGDNQTVIHRSLINLDLVSVVSQVSAAISGITLRDSAVMTNFREKELRREEFKNVPCLQNKETGEMITIKEYQKLIEGAKK